MSQKPTLKKKLLLEMAVPIFLEVHGSIDVVIQSHQNAKDEALKLGFLHDSLWIGGGDYDNDVIYGKRYETDEEFNKRVRKTMTAKQRERDRDLETYQKLKEKLKL